MEGGDSVSFNKKLEIEVSHGFEKVIKIIKELR